MFKKLVFLGINKLYSILFQIWNRIKQTNFIFITLVSIYTGVRFVQSYFLYFLNCFKVLKKFKGSISSLICRSNLQELYLSKDVKVRVYKWNILNLTQNGVNKGNFSHFVKKFIWFRRNYILVYFTPQYL